MGEDLDSRADEAPDQPGGEPIPWANHPDGPLLRNLGIRESSLHEPSALTLQSLTVAAATKAQSPEQAIAEQGRAELQIIQDYYRERPRTGYQG